MSEPVVYTRETAVGLRNAIKQIVERTPVTDIHTHLYAPVFGPLLLRGIDEMLTYHYLVAEYFRYADTSYETFWAWPKTQQADAIWKTLFLDNSPISEACRGVLTALNLLGFDLASPDLAQIRREFARLDVEEHVKLVFDAANIKSAVMTNDPFDDVECPVWKAGYTPDSRFHAVLRIDPLLNDWEGNCHRLQDAGYNVYQRLTSRCIVEVRRFLDDWVKRMNALYMAVSLPPDFVMDDGSARACLIEEAVLPVAQANNIPFAMMIGVTRNVNPALKLAGDSLGTASLAPLEYLCATYPKNKFMVTYLARENQHAAAVTARKFRNLLLFGCWWFLNNPSLIEEMTRMRIELLGTSIIPQHSDARVLDQAVYKWAHSREIISRVLRHKYADLLETGWTITEDAIRRDVEKLLGGNFWSFLQREL
ncbi:MAG: glucuronate isomerase [Candidatus Hydrogenedentes bacterium]|nr:glucuronate isomerase [Candidatus Hydrogenedentota bacterium]